ncbi:PIF1-like helicase [Popillia japonica]|uniref:ATP-dependent DNA helicase n=1 Tax=Popillia japonica TaxID=7064 RepID=A0AAW1IXJ2_POPJA
MSDSMYVNVGCSQAIWRTHCIINFKLGSNERFDVPKNRYLRKMPRKQPLTCRKGKKHGKRQCPGQSNVATSASTTEELTQASDRMTQITNATTTPNSGVATSPKQPRLICTSNHTSQDHMKLKQAMTSKKNKAIAVLEQLLRDQRKPPKRLIERRRFLILYQTLRLRRHLNEHDLIVLATNQVHRGDIDGIDDNNIPEGCICYEPGPANQRCPLHEIEPANDDIVIDDPFNDSFTEILEAADFHTPQDNNPPQPADEIDILPPIPHQVGAADYLLATTRQNIEVHNCGHLDQNCLHCNAKYFALERNSREDPPEQMNIIEDNIDVDAERHEADILVNQLNDEQHNIFDMVIRAVRNDNEPQRLFYISGSGGVGKSRAVRNDNEPQRLFYISGSGGVGKSFLYNCVITRLNALEIKVISVASTGIAAALLKQGRTVHSRFQLPVPIFENSTSRITRDSDDARFIRDAKFLIWDEHHRLQTNMRVRPEEQDFIRWLERLGNNTLPTLNDRLRPNSIEIPPECVTETLDDLIQNIFGDLRPGQVLNKAILTPLNENCHLINERILNQNENQEIVYHSIDDVISDDPETRDMYPVEFLNSLTPSGFPQHTLKLKDGCIIMLLRNLNVRANLCNGTRLLVRHLGELYIDAEIIRFDGQLSNKRVFIPRIDFTTNQTSNLPFIMRRRQFPVRLSYCLTINKSQGQSYDSVGIYLPNAVFDHGQLYVACSRARSMRQLFIHVTDTNNQGRIGQEGRVYTRNIVYDEIL